MCQIPRPACQGLSLAMAGRQARNDRDRNMKHKILFLIGLCLLAVGYMFVVARPSVAPSKPTIQKEAARETISVSQVIFLPSNPNSIPTTVAIEKGKTALDLLQKTATIQLNGQGKEAFVTSINDVAAAAKNKQYWAFYINSKQAQVGAGSYTLVDGDKIEWKLEKY